MTPPVPPELGPPTSFWSRTVEAVAALGSVLRGRRARDVVELLAEYESALADPPPEQGASDDPHFDLLMEVRRRKLKSQLRIEIAYSVLGLLATIICLIVGLSFAWERVVG